MNKPNAYFDKLMKENLGFNTGRHELKRPTTAVLAWRPKIPFLTFEKAMPTRGETELFNQKQLHAKVMNDRVMENNLRKFVHSPDRVKPAVKRSQSHEAISIEKKAKESATSTKPKQDVTD